MNTAYIIVGLGYGDESKGATVDAFTRKFNSSLNVRFNGGPQAAHNVITPEGLHHTFSSFGSGTLAGAWTLYTKDVLINPSSIKKEAEVLKSKGVHNPLSKLSIHEDCRVITPLHIILNKAKESNRTKKHGSCGKGIGETVLDSLNRPNEVLRAKDLKDPVMVFDKIKKTNEVLYGQIKALTWEDFGIDLDLYIEDVCSIASQFNIVNDKQTMTLLDRCTNPIFEGAQGVLLDEDYGFHPYTTWSRATPRNAMEFLTKHDWKGFRRKIGCMRSYMTRHGEGPFSTEFKYVLCSPLYKDHNQTDEWQGEFKNGYLDISALKYAIGACKGVDYLSVSHLDAPLSSPCYVSTCYNSKHGYWQLDNLPENLEDQEQLTNLLLESRPHYQNYATYYNNDLLYLIESQLKTKACLTAHGPKSTDRTWQYI